MTPQTLWLPGAIRKPIPPGTNDPPITPVMVVLHRSASRGESLYYWFAHGSGGIESHGYTRRTGVSEQYRAFNYQADAQAAGNSWSVGGHEFGAISWETEGTGTDQWTPAQLAEITRLLRFVHEQFAIPLMVVHHPQPGSVAAGGVGWHSKYPSWNPGAHDCPGAHNVATIPALVVAAAHTAPPAPKPKPRVLPDGGDMFMPYLIQVKGDPAIYVMTLAGCRHVKNATELEALISGGVPATPKALSAKRLAELLEVE